MSAKRKRSRLGKASVPETYGERYNSRTNVWLFRILIFVVSACPLAGVLALSMSWPWILGSSVYLVLVFMACHIAQQWERVVILRLGRFNRVEGPGFFFTIPFFESASMRVDQRIRVTPFSAEEALTADLVPTNIDAVLFWMVVNPEEAWCEVSNYPEAVSWSAQTALRDAIGQQNLGDLSVNRKEIDRQLQEVLGAKCEDWGITVVSVEIRDIQVPKELQDALSKEAQAERERDARTILAEVEKDISEMFVEAAEIYEKNDKAMQLRSMNLI